MCVCEDGRKSALSALSLQKIGYRRAGYLEGGKAAWGAAGFPLETGREGIDEQPKDVQLKPYDIGRRRDGGLPHLGGESGQEIRAEVRLPVFYSGLVGFGDKPGGAFFLAFSEAMISSSRFSL